MTTTLDLGVSSVGPTPEQWAHAAEYGKRIADQPRPDMILNQMAVTGPSLGERYTTVINELLTLLQFHGTAEAQAALWEARNAIVNDSAVSEANRKLAVLTSRMTETKDQLSRVCQAQVIANSEHTAALGGDDEHEIEKARQNVAALDADASSLTKQRDILTDLLAKAQAAHRDAQSDAVSRAQASLLQSARAKRQDAADKLGQHMMGDEFKAIAESLAAASTLTEIAAGSIYSFENNMTSYLQDGIYFR